MKLPKNKLTKKRYDKLTVFLAAFAVFYLIYAVSQILFINVFKTGANNSNLFFHDAKDYFMDFFNPLFFSANKNPYQYVEYGASYPPLCYALYKLVLLFLPSKDFDSGFALRSNQTMLMFFLLVTLILSALSAIMIHDRFETKKKYLLSLCMILSFPMLYALERGNILLLSFVLLLFFILYKDSENKVVRELAIIALAISAAVKLYPAVFGVLLFFDEKRDFKRIIRCIVYGVLFFAIPFFFFDGISTIKNFIDNVFFAGDFTRSKNFAVTSRLDVHSFIYIALNRVAGQKVSDTLINHLAKAAAALGSIMMAVYILLAKSNWKKCLGLTALTILLPSYSYTYCSLFLLIPLILWFLEKDERSNLFTKAITVLLFFIMVPIPLIPNSLKTSLLLHLMYGFVFLDLIAIIIKKDFALPIKRRKAKQQADA